MSSVSAKQQKLQDWQLSGELTNKRVAADYKAFCQQRPVRGSWHIDLAKVTRVDSAGVAFLLDCLRYSQKHQVGLALSGFSQKLKDLMRVQGVLTLLGEKNGEKSD